jgi:phospholipid/cholesterol/gamma-HCH transport system substrate-binding protein
VKWLSRLVTVTLAALVVGGVALVIVLIVRSPSKFHFRTSAAFRDASRLPVGSRVMIAGVQIGEIDGLTVDGRLARVSMRLRDDIELYDDAWAEKKAESLFGDGYIEVHPGTPDGHRRLASGEPIPRVHEGASTDRTLRSLDQAMPRAQEALAQADGFVKGLRRTIDGPFEAELERIDRAIQDPELVAPLERASDALGRFEDSTNEAADAIARVRPKVAPALDKFDRQVTDATADMREAQASLRESLGNARAGMDDVDPYLDDAVEVVARLDGSEPPEDRGTLAELINDPGLGRELDDLAEGGAAATGTLDKLRTFVGLRYEFNVLARQSQVALGLEIAGNHDSFYLLEIQKNNGGLFPAVELSDSPGSDTFARTARIDEGLLISAQWGHRFDNVSLRFGLREGDFAVGADGTLMGGFLQLKSDLFLHSYRRVPRLKLALAMRVFQSAYVMGGVDDALRTGSDVPVQPWPDEQDVPQSLDHVHEGRDYFVGGYLRFSDRDLDTLLLLYGAAIFATL